MGSLFNLIGVMGYMKVPNTSLKKICFLCAVFVLTLALGTGMNKAFASQNIQSLLTSWFDTKKDASIEQIDQAITSEKERLMVELRESIKIDMKRADAELAQFTADETALRLSMLQGHAKELIEGLHVDSKAEKETITANLDAALVKAMAQLDSSVTVNPTVSAPKPAKGKDTAPEVKDKKNATDHDNNTEVEEKESDVTEDEVEEEKAADKEQGTVEENSPDT